jgi:hypothetical protein
MNGPSIKATGSTVDSHPYKIMIDAHELVQQTDFTFLFPNMVGCESTEGESILFLVVQKPSGRYSSNI